MLIWITARKCWHAQPTEIGTALNTCHFVATIYLLNTCTTTWALFSIWEDPLFRHDFIHHLLKPSLSKTLFKKLSFLTRSSCVLIMKFLYVITFDSAWWHTMISMFTKRTKCKGTRRADSHWRLTFQHDGSLTWWARTVDDVRHSIKTML